MKKNMRLLSFQLMLLITTIFSCSESKHARLENVVSPVLTESATIQVSPHIKLYFTEPCQPNILANELIELINRHSENAYLDLCIYGLNHEGIIAALIEAIKRGVHVRFIGNQDGNSPLADNKGEYYDSYYRIAEALDLVFPGETRRVDYKPGESGFDDFALVNSAGIMHHKYMRITAQTGEEYLITGSTNFTESGLAMNDNNTLVINDSGLADTYRRQFEFLLGLTGAARETTVKQHTIDGILFEVLFSAQGNEGGGPDYRLVDGMMPMEHLLQKVDLAQSTIHFMIFSFTHPDLHDKLAAKQHNNIDVRGIFDSSQANYSLEKTLSQQGIACRLDGNTCTDGYHGGKLHNKVMILDYDQPGAVLITGSFNWSKNSNEENNEDLLFIHSKKMASHYKNRWNKIWDEAIAVETKPAGDAANYQDVIINEVMWMGSALNNGTVDATDEFIELRNMTEKAINLSGWLMEGAGRGGSPLLLDAVIEPYGYLVIMKKPQTASAFQLSAMLQDSQLSIANGNLLLVLRDINGAVIDYAGDGSDGTTFTGYSISGKPLKKSMSRKEMPGDGKIATNWVNANTQVNIAWEYSYYTMATPGANNARGLKTYSPLDVVFSKIAWAGTTTSAYDEWLELYNNTHEDINLAGWTISWDDGATIIDLYGNIPGKGYFLLERTDDNAIPGIAADMIYSGNLGNDGEQVKLTYNATDIDAVDRLAGWIHGSSISNDRSYMRRINLAGTSAQTNWETGPCDYKYATNSKGNTISYCSYCQGCSDSHHLALSIVFTEIAWSGTSASAYDEWLELYNNTASNIDLSQWKIAYGENSFRLSGTILPGRHYLIERGDDASVPEKTADFVHAITRLNDAGENLKLVYNGDVIIDNCDWSSGWPAGISTPVANRLTMERKDVLGYCEDHSNWQHGIGDVAGAQNSFDP